MLCPATAAIVPVVLAKMSAIERRRPLASKVTTSVSPGRTAERLPLPVNAPRTSRNAIAALAGTATVTVWPSAERNRTLAGVVEKSTVVTVPEYVEDEAGATALGRGTAAFACETTTTACVADLYVTDAPNAGANARNGRRIFPTTRRSSMRNTACRNNVVMVTVFCAAFVVT